MRILLASTRGAGHAGPLIPFADAWRRAGHELLAAVAPGAVAQVERAGLPYRVFDPPPDDELGPVWAGVPELSPDEANRVVVAEIFGRLNTRAALPGMIATIESWRPDVVVRETAEFSSSLAASRHGVPQVRVATGLSAFEEWGLGQVAGAIDAIRAELGLPPDPEAAVLRESPYLTVVPATLDDVGAADHARRFSQPAAPGAGGTVAERWPEGDGPLVFVSFGTEAPTMDFFPSLYRAVADALGELSARVLIAIGSEDRDPAELGAVPENVRAELWVPQTDVLAVADVMVGHGGFGSTVTALGAGVPQALVPLFADQPFNARRVEAVGAGIALEGGPGAVADLPAAVRRLLEDPSYRDNAGRLASEMSALPPVGASAALLDELVAAKA